MLCVTVCPAPLDLQPSLPKIRRIASFVVYKIVLSPLHGLLCFWTEIIPSIFFKNLSLKTEGFKEKCSFITF